MTNPGASRICARRSTAAIGVGEILFAPRMWVWVGHGDQLCGPRVTRNASGHIGRQSGTSPARLVQQEWGRSYLRGAFAKKEWGRSLDSGRIRAHPPGPGTSCGPRASRSIRAHRCVRAHPRLELAVAAHRSQKPCSARPGTPGRCSTGALAAHHSPSLAQRRATRPGVRAGSCGPVIGQRESVNAAHRRWTYPFSRASEHVTRGCRAHPAHKNCPGSR